MTHSEMQELLPLYAVNALPHDEDVELRIHVETCTDCSQILQGHVETAGALAAAVEPVEPSPALKQRIFEAVRAPESVQPSRPRRVPMLRRLFPAAAVAAFVAVASLSAVLVRRIDTQNAELQEQRRLLALAGSPQAEALPLKAASQSPGSAGRVFVDPSRDQSGVVLTGLSDPGDEVYALWLIEGGKPKLIENFSPDSSGSATIFVQAEVGQDRPVAVTLEPRPRTSAPQGPAILAS